MRAQGTGRVGTNEVRGSRHIRVLHLADVVNRYDVIDNVVRNLDPSRFDVEVATFTAESNIHPPDYEAAGVVHSVLGANGRKDYPAAALRMARLLRKRDIDIVHAHNFDPNAVAWLATQLRPSARIVVGRHYCDAIYLNSFGARQRANLAIERLVNRRATRIIVPSTAIRDLMIGRQGVPAGKVDMIPYAFDPSHYELPTAKDRAEVRADLGLSSCFAVATIGRLYRDKGHRYMVEAVRQVAQDLPDLTWVIVGDGPDRAQIESAVDQDGLAGRVRVLGWRKDALRLLGAMDAVVQPSLQEAYSQVMAEALWMSRPLVMTDVSGAPDLVTDGETGLVVPRADAGALARALRDLYADAALCERLGRQGRRHVEARLAIPAILPRYEDSYLRAMER